MAQFFKYFGEIRYTNGIRRTLLRMVRDEALYRLLPIRSLILKSRIYDISRDKGHLLEATIVFLLVSSFVKFNIFCNLPIV